MLQTIRDRATGWIAYIIVGFLIVPFALWGVNEYVGGGQSIIAAEVGDGEISLQEFQQAYQQQRQRLQSLLGDQYDAAAFDDARLKSDVLRQLVDERIILLAARDEGFRVGDMQLSAAIRSYDAFQQEGVFDADLYERSLRSQGYSPLSFEEGVRNSLVGSQVQQGIAQTSIVTQRDLDRMIGLLSQKRNLQYATLAVDAYRERVAVSEEDVAAYYKEHSDRFRTPDRLRVSYIDLDADAMAEDIPISEEQLQALYEEQLAKFAQEEQRRASHILVSVPQGAAEDVEQQARERIEGIYDEIASGEKSFEQALDDAKSDGGAEGGDLGVITRGMLDPEFDAALFAVSDPGTVTEPVRTSFGFHVIRLNEIVPAKTKEFADVREEISRDYRRRQAEARFYDEAETLFNLSYEHPDSLEPAAKTLGLKINDSGWFTREGGDGVAQFPQLVTSAFGDAVLNRELNSEPIEVGPSRVIVIRKLEHQPAAPKSIEEAREEIVRELRNQRAQAALQADAEALRERALDGENLEALADEFGGEFASVGFVSRSAADVDRTILAEAFRLPMDVDDNQAVGTAATSDGNRAVIVVSALEPGKPEDLAEEERTVLEQRLETQIGGDEFSAYLDSLRNQTKVVLHADKL